MTRKTVVLFVSCCLVALSIPLSSQAQIKSQEIQVDQKWKGRLSQAKRIDLALDVKLITHETNKPDTEDIESAYKTLLTSLGYELVTQSQDPNLIQVILEVSAHPLYGSYSDSSGIPRYSPTGATVSIQATAKADGLRSFKTEFYQRYEPPSMTSLGDYPKGNNTAKNMAIAPLVELLFLAGQGERFVGIFDSSRIKEKSREESASLFLETFSYHFANQDVFKYLPRWSGELTPVLAAALKTDSDRIQRSACLPIRALKLRSPEIVQALRDISVKTPSSITKEGAKTTLKFLGYEN